MPRLWCAATFAALTGLTSCIPKDAPAADGAARSGGSGAVASPYVPTFSDQPSRSAAIDGLSRGLNLGNGLDAPREGEWGVVLSEAHFDHVAAAGMDHVRLPVRFSARADDTPPYTIDEVFFERVDWAVDQALGRDLAVIVDLHHYEELMKEPDAHADRFVAMWKQIAERYRERPQRVVFELLNEPSANLKPDDLNRLMNRTIETIRSSNPTRLLIVDSYFWAAAEYLDELELPEDPQIVASFHMYQPILFTHQGAAWMPAEYQTTGLIFPGPPRVPIEPVPEAKAIGWVRSWFASYNSDPITTNQGGPARVAAEFDRVSAYVKATGRRVYLGEFAAIDKADPQSRENFVRLTRMEAERRGIGWAYWDDGGMNRAIDVKTGQWVPYLRDALLGN